MEKDLVGREKKLERDIIRREKEWRETQLGEKRDGDRLSEERKEMERDITKREKRWREKQQGEKEMERHME